MQMHDNAAKRWVEERANLADAVKRARQEAGDLRDEIEEGRRRERALEVWTMLLRASTYDRSEKLFQTARTSPSMLDSQISCRKASKQPTCAR